MNLNRFESMNISGWAHQKLMTRFSNFFNDIKFGRLAFFLFRFTRFETLKMINYDLLSLDREAVFEFGSPGKFSLRFRWGVKWFHPSLIPTVVVWLLSGSASEINFWQFALQTTKIQFSFWKHKNIISSYSGSRG